MDDDASALERFRVHEAISRYVDALNHRDWEAFADCWIEDARFQMVFDSDEGALPETLTTIERPAGVRVHGRDQILTMVSRYNTYPWLVQMPHGVYAELDGPGRARSRHTLEVKSHALNLIGLCYDSLVRSADGRWRFAVRDYRPSYFEYAEAKGLTVRKMPDPNYRNLPDVG
jgi:hypothetical protein